MIAVGRLQPWDDSFEASIPIKFKFDGFGVGFLPVYETREEAAKEYPEGPFFEVTLAVAKRGDSR